MKHMLNTTTYEVYSDEMEFSSGCYVSESDNKKKVDFESGVWCTCLGHNNEKINQAIIKQLEKNSHTGYRYSSKVVSQAAERLLELTDFKNGKCVFLSSGSEAVDFAVRAIRSLSKKKYFLSLQNHFLSSYGESAAQAEGWLSINTWELSDEDDFTELLDKIPFEEIGAFVFEPGNASGLVHLPNNKFIQRLAKTLKDYQIPVIVDEVTTGFGRTGEWFGYHHFEISPDVVVLGKSIGNGYPVSAILVTEELADEISQSGFKHAQSHQNDPLGCAVILETVAQITDNQLIPEAKEIGAYFYNELLTLSKEKSSIVQVRGTGLMLAIEICSDKGIDLNEKHRELFEKGFIVGISPAFQTLRFYPPLIIKKEMIDDLIATLSLILD